MANIKDLYEDSARTTPIFPRTHTKAVVDDNGNTAESRLGALQDLINMKQLEFGAVEIDTKPTSGNTDHVVSSGGIKSYIDNLSNNITIDPSSYSENNKYINSSNAWVSGTSTYNKSINVPVNGGDVYELQANITNGSIYALLKSDTAVGTAVDFSAYADSRVVLSAGKKVRITIPLDATILYIFKNTSEGSYLPYSIRKIGTIADVNNKIEKVDGELNSLENVVLDNMNVNFSSYGTNSKNIGSDNKWKTTSTSKNIPVNAGEFYELTANATNETVYALLKSNTTTSNPVDFSAYANCRIVLAAGEKAKIIIPSDTTILYVSVGSSSAYLPSSLVKKVSKSTENVYHNGVMLGDSITYGVYSYYNNSQRYNGVQTTNGISDELGKLLGCSITNYGRRGTGYVADTRNINNAWEQVSTMDFTNIDLCVMMFGVNDYIQHVSMGTLEANAEGTVVGNMTRVFNKIMTDNPLCKIVCVGSYNCWGQVSVGGDYTANDHYGDSTTDYALGYAINGHTLRDYLDLQKQVCEKYHVQFFCLADAGIVNFYNMEGVLPDGLHPTLESRKFIAQEIAKVIV